MSVAQRLALIILHVAIAPSAWAGDMTDRPSDQQIKSEWQSHLDHQPAFQNKMTAGWKYRIEPKFCELEKSDDPWIVCHTTFWLKEPNHSWKQAPLASLWVKNINGWQPWKAK